MKQLTKNAECKVPAPTVAPTCLEMPKVVRFELEAVLVNGSPSYYGVFDKDGELISALPKSIVKAHLQDRLMFDLMTFKSWSYWASRVKKAICRTSNWEGKKGPWDKKLVSMAASLRKRLVNGKRRRLKGYKTHCWTKACARMLYRFTTKERDRNDCEWSKWADSRRRNIAKRHQIKERQCD